MKKLILFLAVIFTTNSLWALEEESYEDYDTMVNEMTSKAPKKHGDLFDFDSLNLHFGFGFNNSMLNLKSKNESPSNVSVQGFTLGMGIDLFSPEYVAEADYSNYNPSDKEEYSYKLREFDLKVYYHKHLNSFFIGKAGGGLGARYLTVTSPNGNSESDSTPVGMIFVGGEIMLGNHLGFLSDLTFKNALSGGTPEKYSLDLALGVSGHF
jgi:hypothetical protein